jgi:DNA-(apurinic or apyrimidinic site) lyase (EC 4.2.99.18)/endonuclease III (EC 3.2.2.-)
MDEKTLAKEVYQRLLNIYKNPKIDLEFDNPFELLIETVLAAQEKDEKVNSIRKSFFSKFKDPKALKEAPLEEIKEAIKSISFYNKKAIAIKEIATILVDKYNSQVPDEEDELVKLPGVGKKTANMVLASAFRKPAIAVDRHVHRIVQRLGLDKNKDPDKTTEHLKSIVDKELWTTFYLLLLRHAKEVCTAKNPKCQECVLKDICESFGKIK